MLVLTVLAKEPGKTRAVVGVEEVLKGVGQREREWDMEREREREREMETERERERERGKEINTGTRKQAILCI